MTDLYAVLGVTCSASKEHIKSAYKRAGPDDPPG